MELKSLTINEKQYVIYTPEKGVDYFTEEEKKQLAEQIINEVTPEKIDAAPMDYAKKVGNPYNLLDNSDFRNPVNQRGIVSGRNTANAYWIDRWKLGNSGTITFEDGWITISANVEHPVYLSQTAESPFPFPCTVCVTTTNGDFVCNFFGNSRATHADGWYVQISNGSLLSIMIPYGASLSIVNLALYEGEYTAETLPAYKPKGYGAELAECQRYFYAISGATYSKAGFGQAEGNNTVYPMVIVPVPMRVRPTVTYSGNWKLWDGSTEIAIASIAINAGATPPNNCSQISLTVNGGAPLTVGKVYTLTVRNDATAYLWLSADL